MPLPGVPEDFLLKGLGLCWPAFSGPGAKQDPSGHGTYIVQLGWVSLSSLAFLSAVSPDTRVP